MTAGVNEAATDEWVAETTTFQRVRSVMRTTYDGQTTSEIAARAHVSETTARKHLEDLAESGYVDSSPSSEGATRYARSTESLILEEAHDILERVETGELVQQITDMEAELESYRDEFDAENPEQAAIAGTVIDQQTLTAWQTTRRNLSFARTALALSESKETVQATNAV
ncbi:ArsR family transcriptional regulator [Halobacteria archaeon AArc-m2/3/4]|uniref:ArsR family transcriptional regulator n=1 Tax=Natronoglomus mannanivorans TaxID=2979990 RepID=A0AAP2YZF1_9EURY|nr:ArsR family transcriptional regulator [Halobacteria archaeon AArc-xg1-1]MCU4975413.1 ArsR family transcriptional regulator [Halobacteria archaeon AArc-m2/3/4]